jgi:hypothetical protein
MNEMRIVWEEGRTEEEEKNRRMRGRELEKN